jgi:hypothetical protein
MEGVTYIVTGIEFCADDGEADVGTDNGGDTAEEGPACDEAGSEDGYEDWGGALLLVPGLLG